MRIPTTIRGERRARVRGSSSGNHHAHDRRRRDQRGGVPRRHGGQHPGGGTRLLDGGGHGRERPPDGRREPPYRPGGGRPEPGPDEHHHARGGADDGARRPQCGTRGKGRRRGRLRRPAVLRSSRRRGHRRLLQDRRRGCRPSALRLQPSPGYGREYYTRPDATASGQRAAAHRVSSTPPPT